jgi:hypothetical protein
VKFLVQKVSAETEVCDKKYQAYIEYVADNFLSATQSQYLGEQNIL